MILSINAADKKLKNLLQQFSLGPAVKPLNLLAEREAFLHPRLPLRRKSPVFTYADPSLQWADFKPSISLESIDAPEDVIDIYHEKLQELEMTRKMFFSVGTDRFTEYSIQIFGVPTSVDANRARKVLEKLSDVIPPERNRSAKEFANLLDARLEKLGIAMSIRLVSEMATKISVDSVSRTIFLDRNTLFAPEEIRRLLVHEINVHAVRIYNGSCLPWGVFTLGTAGYREAEEGLAVHHERRTGHLYPFQEKVYAGRCLAVYLSLSAGFADVFEELLSYFDEKTAYAIVERVKRGLADTSRPGALTKEYHYFTGPGRVQSFLQSGGSLQILMGGKIAFRHAKVMAKLVQNSHADTSKWIFPEGITDD